MRTEVVAEAQCTKVKYDIGAIVNYGHVYARDEDEQHHDPLKALCFFGALGHFKTFESFGQSVACAVLRLDLGAVMSRGAFAMHFQAPRMYHPGGSRKTA